MGLGKTHLIQAIGNHVFQKNPQAKIRYIHAERYVADIMRAYQHKAFDEFKRYYHSLDLLLIDDIQFFAGKNRTQEEFFYAFNALIEGGKQVIMTCDSYPKQIEGMEERLISRFSWGLTVEIQPPELEMRVAILMKRPRPTASSWTTTWPSSLPRTCAPTCANWKARSSAWWPTPASPIRTSRWNWSRKRSGHPGRRQPPGDRGRHPENRGRVLQDQAVRHAQQKRSRDIARPRQVAMALAKELTQLSLPNIGDAFGGRDHTTVLHACKTIAEMRGNDADIAHDYDTLLAMLRN